MYMDEISYGFQEDYSLISINEGANNALLD